MRVQDIMSRPVETIASSTAVVEAREAMKRQGIHHLVVKDGRKIVGVVSARDLKGCEPGERVREVMAESVATAAPTATVRAVANLLRGRGVGCLPVVAAGRIVGIVTISDLLEQIGKGSERPRKNSVRWTLRARGPRKSRPSADRQSLTYAP
jgi:acetoin utilization protein AcuB